ncbi:odorant receptor 49a-like [Linepithema humile]|uniref:odorant receptor 49a-like n=1 Tax=Linepithema humile TaxID=83485 RepID=UPI0006236A5E|nr:PREDICTED: odorant receptor 49a-like [Linepithema humile]
MDFQNVNPLNVRLNLISGNLLPLTSDDSDFSITWKLYGICTWLIEVIQIIVLIPGMVLAPWEKVLRDGTVTSVLTVEVFFMITRIYSRRKLTTQLIQRLNDILRVADKTMKCIVTTTLKPMEFPLKFYWISGWSSVFAWSCTPFLLILEKASFLYEDYRMPVVFSKQPFSTEIFLLGNIFMLFGNMYIFIKKVGLDVYMIHLVLLITAQYRYISARLVAIFQEESLRNKFNESSRIYPSEIDRSAEKEMKMICQHYRTVIHLSLTLKKLLSLNFSLIYVNSVFRFCFIGIMVRTVADTTGSTTFVDGLSIFMYACGSIVQFYVLCFSVQQLLDASTEITKKAFHEKWYHYGPSIRRTFMMMILANNLECKVAACDKFNLSLPSFMTIMNQSYSICLLLLRSR